MSRRHLFLERKSNNKAVKHRAVQDNFVGFLFFNPDLTWPHSSHQGILESYSGLAPWGTQCPEKAMVAC